MYAWKERGELVFNQVTPPAVKHKVGNNLMVWSCMGLYGEEWVGKLVKVEGKIDAKQFCEILEDSLMENFETLGIEVGEHYVQQDNNSKCTSKKSKKWSENNGI